MQKDVPFDLHNGTSVFIITSYSYSIRLIWFPRYVVVLFIQPILYLFLLSIFNRFFSFFEDIFYQFFVTNPSLFVCRIIKEYCDFHQTNHRILTTYRTPENRCATGYILSHETQDSNTCSAVLSFISSTQPIAGFPQVFTQPFHWIKSLRLFPFPSSRLIHVCYESQDSIIRSNSPLRS